MAYLSRNRMSVLNNNFVFTVATPTWTDDGITSFSPGLTLANLNVDDTHTKVQTISVSSPNPRIIADFGFGVLCDSFGIVNHDLFTTSHTTLTVSHAAAIGGPWTDVGAAIVLASDADLAFTFVGATDRYWSVIVAGTTNNFALGYLYFGDSYELSSNPQDAQMIQTRTSNQVYVESGGAAIHVIKRRNYRRVDAEISWVRQPAADTDMLRVIPDGTIVGIISPEYAQKSEDSPLGQEVFFGFIDRMSTSPRTVGSILTSSHKYDTTLTMRGAV